MVFHAIKQQTLTGVESRNSMSNKLEKLVETSMDYDKESQDFIKSLKLIDQEISDIDSMKRTSGWKILDKKIRDELQNRIKEMVKDDPKIMTLIALLSVASTKSMSKELDEEVERLLPE